MQLEVIACSVADAVAAERGGATRLEVISHFEQDGLTPPMALVQNILDIVHISVRVMLRARNDFAIGDEAEQEALCELANAYAQSSVDGLVLGFVRDGQIDIHATQQILTCAPNLKATFHRAVESVNDPFLAIETLKQLPQIDTVLTNGGSGAWEDKVERLAKLEHQARPNMHVLVGGGVDCHAVETVCAATPIRAFHLGRAVREPQTVHGVVSTARVAAIRQCLAAFDLSQISHQCE